MKRRIGIIIVFLITALFQACKTKDKNVINFEKKYPNISLQHHYIFNIEKSKEHLVYEMMLDTSNCHEYISFGVLKIDFGAKKEGDVSFNSYLRREPVNKILIRKISFNQNRDTLYSYLEKNDTLLNFTCGRYYYYYNHRGYKLTKYQKEYFENNKDSIIKNRINEIPDFDMDKIEGKCVLLSP